MRSPAFSRVLSIFSLLPEATARLRAGEVSSQLRLVVVCDPSERAGLVGRFYRDLDAAGMMPTGVTVVSVGTRAARVEACVSYTPEQWTALMILVQRVGQLERVHSARWTRVRIC